MNPDNTHCRPRSTASGRVLAGLVFLWAPCASAWVVDLTSKPREIFMYVGTASFQSWGERDDGDFKNSVDNNNTQDTVSGTVPFDQVGQSRAVTLTLAGTSAQCPTTGIQIGAGYRRDGFSRRNFTVQVTAPATLIDANTGNGLPITDIVVTTADAGRSPEWPASFTLSAGSQELVRESASQLTRACLSFSYKNDVVRAAGTYRGSITFTATAVP